MIEIRKNVILEIAFGMPIPQLFTKCNDFTMDNEDIVFEITHINKIEWIQKNKNPAIKISCTIRYKMQVKEYTNQISIFDKPKLTVLKGNKHV